MHDLDAEARAPCTCHGARVVLTCSKKGSLPWGDAVQPGQAEAMGSICHCPVTAMPCQPWAHLSHFQQPWGSGEHLENGFSWKIKIINRKLKKGKCEKLTSKTSSSKCKACPSSCSALVVFLESVACTLRNKKTTG